MYRNGFGINILQWLMCHQTKPKSCYSTFLSIDHELSEATISKYLLNWIQMLHFVLFGTVFSNVFGKPQHKKLG